MSIGESRNGRQPPPAAPPAPPQAPVVPSAHALPVRPPDAPHTPESFELGPFRIEAAPGWAFFPMDDSIAGRPQTRVGIFRVSLVPDVVLPRPATHEVCMAAAMATCGYDVRGPGVDPARDRVGRAVFGGESFRTRGTFVRVYYHVGPAGFVVATFSCKASRAIEKLGRQAIRDCDQMMLSIRLPTAHPG